MNSRGEAMKKYFLTALLALFLPLALAAQEDVVELRMVSTDSLVSYLRGLDRGAFYFRKDADDRTLFTVKARSSEFFEAALAEIRSKGYTISRYDGAWSANSLPATSAPLRPRTRDPN